MIVEADFITHWKIKALCNALGEGPALKAVLSLWAHCQTRRAWQFPLTPLRLAGICGFEGQREQLWDAMVELPLIVPVAGEFGWWEVHQWAERNSALIHNWGARCGGWHPKGRALKGVSSEGSKDVSKDAALEGSDVTLVLSADDSKDGSIRLDKIREEKKSPPNPPGGGEDSPVSAKAKAGNGGQECPPHLGDEPPTGSRSRKKKRGAAAGPVELVFPEDWSKDRQRPVREWVAFKLEQWGVSYKPLGFGKLLATLEPLDDGQLRRCVDLSMANGWKGLFPSQVLEHPGREPGFGPQKKGGGGGAQVGTPVSRGTAAPDGWERAMPALWGDDWRLLFAAWELVPTADQRQVRAWLEKNKGGAA